MTEGICTPPSITLQGTSTLVIDVQAFSLGLGKPTGVGTFGEFGVNFLHTLINLGGDCQKIDIAFDHYLNKSIKGSTRKKQSHSLCPLSMLCPFDEKKQDLSEFL